MKLLSVFTIRNSVSKKLFITFFLSVSLLVSFMGFVTYQIAKNSVITKVQENSRHSLVQTMKRLDQMLQFYENITNHYLNPDLQRDIENLTFSELYSYEQISRWERVNGHSEYLFSNDPRVLSWKLLPAYPVRPEEWFTHVLKAKGKPVFLEPQREGYVAAKSKNVFAIGRVIMSIRSKLPIAVLILEMDGALLKEELDALKTYDSSKLYLLNSEGLVIQSTTSNVPLREPFPLWEAVRDNQVSNAAVLSNGQRVSLLSYTSPVTHWTVVHEYTHDHLLFETNHIWRVTAISLVITMLLSLLLGYMIVRTVGIPLSKLSQLMRTSETDMSVRAHFSSSDEIGLLGNSFNRMLTKISELVTETARTAQLEMQYQLETEHRQLVELMNNSFTLISSTLDTQDVTRIALSQLNHIVRIRRAEIWLRNEHGYELSASFDQNTDEHEALPAAILTSANLSKPCPEANGKWFQPENTPPGSHQIWVFPMANRDRQNGFLAIELDKSEHVNEPTKELIVTLTKHITIALENAQLYHEMSRIANYDGLTGIYNRRHLLVLAEKHFVSARERALPLSVILFDIDYFKKCNDTYGHLAGDAVLKSVAETAAALIGEECCPFGRYGGEEFIVVLPSYSVDDTRRKAEAIRSAIEQTSVTYGGQEITVTASFGVAGLTPDMSTLLECINNADKALYRAKAEGRNRVI